MPTPEERRLEVEAVLERKRIEHAAMDQVTLEKKANDLAFGIEHLTGMILMYEEMIGEVVDAHSAGDAQRLDASIHALKEKISGDE